MTAILEHIKSIAFQRFYIRYMNSRGPGSSVV